MPLSSLHLVEQQLVMQCCDLRSLLRFARCSRSTRAAAADAFAWRFLQCVQRRCGGQDAPIPLLRKAVRWLTGRVAHTSHASPPVGVLLTPAQLVRSLSSPLLRHCSFDVEWTIQADAEALDEQVCSVASLPRLAGLTVIGERRGETMQYCALSNAQLIALCTALQAAGHHHTLTKFAIQGHPFDAAARIAITSFLALCPLLREVHIARRSVDVAGTKALFGSLNPVASSLSHLTLRCLNVYGAGQQQEPTLAGLVHRAKSTLQHLDLEESNVGLPTLEGLFAVLPQCSLLRTLSLSRCLLHDSSLVVIGRALPLLRSLHTLHLASMRQVSHDSWDPVAAALPRMPALCSLTLDSQTVGGLLGAAISACAGMTQLSLRRADIGEQDTITLLEALAQSACIRSVALPCVSSTDMSAIAAAVMRSASWQALHVDLRCNDMDALAAILPLSRLTNLSVASLASSGSLSFFQARLCGVLDTIGTAPLLRRLHLSRVTLDVAAVNALAASLQKSSCALQSLSLRHCDLGATGISVIAAALPASSVTHLTILQRQPKSSDIFALTAAAAQSPRLMRLQLLQPDRADSSVTRALRRLRHTRPELEIACEWNNVHEENDAWEGRA